MNIIFQLVLGLLSDDGFIVNPVVIEENGHSTFKDLNKFQSYFNKVKIAFEFGATQLVLDLERNEKLLNRRKPLIVERFKKNKTIQSEPLRFEEHSCHFIGHIMNRTDSFASVSLCDRIVSNVLSDFFLEDSL